MKFLVALSCLLALGEANDECPDLSVVSHFDVHRFLGKWYEYKHNKLAQAFDMFGDCVSAEYKLDDVTGNILIKNSDVLNVFGFKKNNSIEGVAIPHESGIGVLHVDLKTLVGHVKSRLHILATDYDSYAILYSCTEVLGYPIQTIWVMRRDPKLEGKEKECFEEKMKLAFVIIEKEGGPKLETLSISNQHNCHGEYY